jgi:hypothetical protein
MIRGGVLTLATLGALGVGFVARADEWSLAGWPDWWASLYPTTAEDYPRLPENWSDLPFQLHMSETMQYNSNITNTPTGPTASALYGRPVGGMVSISNYGVSFKREWEGQGFFGDANWGMYRYFNEGSFNSAHSAVDIGDNFTLGSKCKGTLKASEASTPSAPGQQVGYNVINTLTTTSFTEDAKCVINGEFTGIINSGTNTSTNTAALDKQNDYQSVFVAAGISYAVSETNSLQVLATITGLNYTDRQAETTTTSASLVNNLTTDEVMATYVKNVGPTLALNAQFGVLGIVNNYFDLAIPRTILPEYGLSAQWTATPKLSFNAAVSRMASAPTTLVANLQITESASLGFAYHYTPKLTLSGNVQASYANSEVDVQGTETVLNRYTTNQKTYTAGAGLAYAMTPFVTANLSYQFYRSIQANLTTNSSLIMLALNFNPL